MAQWIKADGTIENISDHKFELSELQGYVGGYIELVYISDNQIMVVNEEGVLLGLPKNETASLRYQKSIRDFCTDPNVTAYIAGDVLVCNSDLID